MFQIIKQMPAVSALLAAVLALVLLLLSFFMLEPTVGRAAVDTEQFIVSQSITSEISFLTAVADVSMSPSLGGIAGGTANGQTQVIVNTNNTTGYNMTINFASSSYGTDAMNRNGGGGYIDDYTNSSSTVPDYTFTAETYAQFAYAVQGSTTADVDQTFKSNGSNTCNTGSTNTAGTCWMRPSTTNERIVNRTTSTAASGATTTIQFRINVPSNPSPAVPTGTYTATATLTATTN